MAEPATTGEVRDFLAAVMTSIKDGSMTLGQAREITNAARAITESLNTDVKIARTLLDTGLQAANLGAIPIGRGKAIPLSEVQQNVVQMVEHISPDDEQGISLALEQELE